MTHPGRRLQLQPPGEPRSANHFSNAAQLFLPDKVYVHFVQPLHDHEGLYAWTTATVIKCVALCSAQLHIRQALHTGMFQSAQD